MKRKGLDSLRMIEVHHDDAPRNRCRDPHLDHAPRSAPSFHGPLALLPHESGAMELAARFLLPLEPRVLCSWTVPTWFSISPKFVAMLVAANSPSNNCSISSTRPNKPSADWRPTNADLPNASPSRSLKPAPNRPRPIPTPIRQLPTRPTVWMPKTNGDKAGVAVRNLQAARRPM